MAANDQTVRNVLTWDVNAQSVAKAIAANNQIGATTAAAAKRAADATSGARNVTEAYNSVIGKLGASASTSLTLVEQKMRDGERATERLRRTTSQAGDEFDALARSASTAARASASVSASGGGLATARSAAGAAGGVLATVGGGQAASAASSILGLTATLGPVGLAAGVATVAFSALQQEMERGRQAAEEYANQLKSNADLVAGGATSADVQTQVANLQTARSFVANELAELTSVKEQIIGVIPDAFAESAARIGNSISKLQGSGNTQLFDNFNQLLEEISARTGEEIQTVAQLDTYIASTQTTVNTYATQIDNLNGLLASGALAAADAAAATADVAEAQQQLSILNRQLDQVYLDSSQAALEADRLSREEREKRIADIQAEIDSYQALIDSGNLHDETITNLNASIGRLTVRQEAYRDAVNTTGDALARSAQQRTDAENALSFERLTAAQRQERIAANEAEIKNIREYIEANDLSADVIQSLSNKQTDLYVQTTQLRDITESYADVLEREKTAKEALTARNQQILDLEGQYVTAREKAFAAEQKANEAQAAEDIAVAEARAESADKLRAIEIEAGEDRAKITQDSQDKVNKIVKEAGRAFGEAVGNRDANAYRQADIRRVDDLEDQQLADRRRFEESAKANTKTVAAEIKAGNERVRAAEMSADKTIATARQEAEAQYFIADRARASAEFLAASGMNNVVSTTANGWRILESTFATGFQNIINATARQLRSGGGSSSFPTLTNSAAGRALDARTFNQQFDQRYVQIKTAARGGRTLIA